MSEYRSVSLPAGEAPAFEQQLQSRGYRERPSTLKSTLQSREYTKKHGTSDPNSFGGQPVVAFEICEST